jgi:N utilization substance protein B
MTEQKNKNRKRTLSRLVAAQILYQHDFHQRKKSYEEIKEELVANYVLDSEEEITSYKEKIDEEFLNQLLSATAVFEKLDQEIEPLLQQPVAKLDLLILQILRLAIFELKILQDAPNKVVIDEYVGIAASFFDRKKVTFTNAILDKFKDNSK